MAAMDAYGPMKSHENQTQKICCNKKTLDARIFTENYSMGTPHSRYNGWIAKTPPEWLQFSFRKRPSQPNPLRAVSFMKIWIRWIWEVQNSPKSNPNSPRTHPKHPGTSIPHTHGWSKQCNGHSKGSGQPDKGQYLPCQLAHRKAENKSCLLA